MADTRNLTMTYTLDNGDDFDVNLANAKEGLTKTEVDAVMQDAIDAQAFIKDGHYPTAIKEAYVTTTSKEVLE